ncbi:MAG: hypothetical protein ACYSTZ_00020 [Planctomycetota bacterium]|jgi:hypothetical protein
MKIKTVAIWITIVGIQLQLVGTFIYLRQERIVADTRWGILTKKIIELHEGEKDE